MTKAVFMRTDDTRRTAIRKHGTRGKLVDTCDQNKIKRTAGDNLARTVFELPGRKGGRRNQIF
jgi:hypothetical protein